VLTEGCGAKCGNFGHGCNNIHSYRKDQALPLHKRHFGQLFPARRRAPRPTAAGKRQNAPTPAACRGFPDSANNSAIRAKPVLSSPCDDGSSSSTCTSADWMPDYIKFPKGASHGLLRTECQAVAMPQVRRTGRQRQVCRLPEADQRVQLPGEVK
jgi:hypothetical protein